MKLSLRNMFRLNIVIFLLALGLLNGTFVLCIEAQGNAQIEIANESDGCADCPQQQHKENTDNCGPDCCIGIPLHSVSISTPKTFESEFSLIQHSIDLSFLWNELFSLANYKLTDQIPIPVKQFNENFPLTTKKIVLLV